MVSRLEIALLVVIVLFGLDTLREESVTIHNVKSSKNIELEIWDAHMREINQTAVHSAITGRRLVKTPKKITFYDFNFTSPEIVELSSRTAYEKNRIVTLEKNITLIKPDNVRYFADHVDYNRDTRIMDIEGFRSQEPTGRIAGSSLRYDLNKKEIDAKRVKARYQLTPAKQ